MFLYKTYPAKPRRIRGTSSEIWLASVGWNYIFLHFLVEEISCVLGCWGFSSCPHVRAPRRLNCRLCACVLTCLAFCVRLVCEFLCADQVMGVFLCLGACVRADMCLSVVFPTVWASLWCEWLLHMIYDGNNLASLCLPRSLSLSLRVHLFQVVFNYGYAFTYQLWSNRNCFSRFINNLSLHYFQLAKKKKKKQEKS